METNCSAEESNTNQNANQDGNLDTVQELPQPRTHEAQENSDSSDYDSTSATLSSLFSAVRQPLPEKLQAKDITERAQQLIENLNAKRKFDSQLIEEYRQALEAQVQKSVSTLQQYMFQRYETQQGVIEAKLQELFASLDKAAVNETELDNFRQSFSMLYTEMQNIE